MMQKWQRPQSQAKRFGFEVTMYVAAKSGADSMGKKVNVSLSRRLQVFLVLVTGLLGVSGLQAQAWKLSGYDSQNTANSSSTSDITKKTAKNLKLKWIYEIEKVPSGPLNPPENPRMFNAAAQGAVVDTGKAYFNLFDGRIITLSTDQLDGVNANGSPKPKLLNTFDLFSDPKYYGESDLDGDDVFNSRIPLSMVGNTVFAGGYRAFANVTQLGTFADKATGTTNPSNPNYVSKGAMLYGIDKNSGNLLWKSNVDPNPMSGMAATGLTKWDSSVFVGWTSILTGHLGVFPADMQPDPFGGHCCDHRGGVAAVDPNTGKVKWRTYTLPQQEYRTLDEIKINGNVDAWSGAGVWGSGNFPVSTKLKLVYAGFGEAATAPDEASECETARLAQPFAPPFDEKCLKINQDGTSIARSYGTGVGNVVESPGVNSPGLPLTSGVMAMDVETGAVKWARPLHGFDVWNFSCFGAFGFAANFSYFCPPYLRTDPLLQFNYKDLDVAEQPILVEGVRIAQGKKDLLLVTAKSSRIWALDAETGEIIWGPKSFGQGNFSTDGILWGSATDGKRLYTNNGRASDINLSNLNNPEKAVVPGSCIADGFDANGNWTGGMYIAVDLATGNTAWQRCVTGKDLDANGFPNGHVSAGRTQAGMSVSNGVVLAPGATSYTTPGQVSDNPFAEVLLLDADTGLEIADRLALSIPGEPSAQTLVYQRPIAVGNKVYITNGYHSASQSSIPGPFDVGNRVVVYEIK